MLRDITRTVITWKQAKTLRRDLEIYHILMQELYILLLLILFNLLYIQRDRIYYRLASLCSGRT